MCVYVCFCVCRTDGVFSVSWRVYFRHVVSTCLCVCVFILRVLRTNGVFSVSWRGYFRHVVTTCLCVCLFSVCFALMVCFVKSVCRGVRKERSLRVRGPHL